MMIRARDMFVFRKAMALARRMPTEPNKRESAHVICQRLVALLNLGRDGHGRDKAADLNRHSL